ncbi:MAG: hypothetical protein ACYC5X_12085, partial [Syntrophales bacterium]
TAATSPPGLSLIPWSVSIVRITALDPPLLVTTREQGDPELKTPAPEFFLPCFGFDPFPA